MKTFESYIRFVVTIIVFVWYSASIQSAELKWREQFDQGLIQEEVHQDLDKAIEHYEGIVTAFDEQHDVIAMSIYRLAECLRKLGRIDEAAPLYERIVNDFPRQGSLVLLSQRFVPETQRAVPNQLSNTQDERLVNHPDSLKFLIDQIKEADTDDALQMLVEFTNDDTARNQLFQYHQAQAELSKLKIRYLDKWPGVKAQQQIVSNLEAQMNKHVDQSVRILEVRLVALKRMKKPDTLPNNLMGNAPLPTSVRLDERPETLRLFIEELEEATTELAIQMLKEEANIELASNLMEEKRSLEMKLSSSGNKHPLFESLKEQYQYIHEQLHEFVHTSIQHLNIKLRILESVDVTAKNVVSNQSTRMVDNLETLELFIQELEKYPNEVVLQMLIQETDFKAPENLLNDKSELTTELKGAYQTLGSDHPRIKELRGKLISIEEQLSDLMSQSIQQLRIKLGILKRTNKDSNISSR